MVGDGGRTRVEGRPKRAGLPPRPLQVCFPAAATWARQGCLLPLRGGVELPFHAFTSLLHSNIRSALARGHTLAVVIATCCLRWMMAQVPWSSGGSGMIHLYVSLPA
jgi:hypothetical protein